MLIGYARVSTLDQDTSLQLDALAKAGVRRIYQDKSSGVGARPQLHLAISKLKPGDTLVVWKLDRIARSLADLLGIIQRLKDQGAMIKSLTEPIDTSNPIGEFTLQILGAVAQLERSMIRERVNAGFAAAKARGQRFGRQRSMSPEVEAHAVSLCLDYGFTMREVADRYGVGLSSVKRAVYRVSKPGHSSLE